MVDSVVARTFDSLCDKSPVLKRLLIRNWFYCLSLLDREAHMPFMNLGYAPLKSVDTLVELQESDEEHRYCIQMYHHVASMVELSGRDVLEVGSGRGGGASYVKRYLGPRTMVGVDLVPRAVQFSRARHRVDGLSFVQGDAERLPFGNCSFDAVINVESSYAYGNVDRFLQEVARVLRPGGYFLFTDYRYQHRIGLLRAQIENCGLNVLSDRCINAEVVRALDLDHARKADLIKKKVPQALHNVMHYFAASPGSPIYDELKAGTVDYHSWLMQKTPADVSQGTEDAELSKADSLAL
ncbi:class I SAM-dependent methyltransferase [Ktedonosporobacter rubrisoli]|nr:class I SAM-dependent methyltransferase [Ktedonosporobacter rubrisoli]